MLAAGDRPAAGPVVEQGAGRREAGKWISHLGFTDTEETMACEVDSIESPAQPTMQ